MKILGATLIGFFSLNAFAADHIDGPVTTAHRVTDITDFFAFVPQDQPGKLVLSLNTYPFVQENGHFSEKVRYTFHNKKFKIENNKFKVSEEFNIVCSFKDEHGAEEMECTTNTGVSSKTSKNSLTSTGDFKSYFGRVADPLLLNTDWFRALAMEGKILPPIEEGNNDIKKNTMSLLSALNITLVIDIKSLFPNSEGTQYACAVSSEGVNAAGVFEQIDWMGKPEITNFVLQKPVPGDTIRDDYNKEKPFVVEGAPRYLARIQERIPFLDNADGKIDWKSETEEEKEKLSRLFEVLTNDYLIVDLNESITPSEDDNYLEIENAYINQKDSKTSGGRKPKDDIMDTLFTLCVNSGDGKTGTVILDGISKQFQTPYTQIPIEFPYQGISYYDVNDPNSDADEQIKAIAVAKQKALIEQLAGRPAAPTPNNPNPAQPHAGHGHNHE